MFKELWFLENPIETKIGVCKFIKVREYEKFLILSSVLQTEKTEVIKFIKENNNIPVQDIDEVITSLNALPFIEIIKEIKWLGLYEGYSGLFDLCFENKGSFDLITTDEDLNFYTNLIKEMNCLEFEKPIINPELAYFNKLEQIAKERKGEVITFKSMVTSVGLYKDNVLDISIYNLHEYFARITYFKNYDTTILIQTVNTEKMNLTPWYCDGTVKKTELDNLDKNFIDKHLIMVKNDPTKDGIIETIQK